MTTLMSEPSSHGSLVGGQHCTANTLIDLMSDQGDPAVVGTAGSTRCVVWTAVVNDDDVINEVRHRLDDLRDVVFFFIGRYYRGNSNASIHRLSFAAVRCEFLFRRIGFRLAV
jgi:hypothetical protein